MKLKSITLVPAAPLRFSTLVAIATTTLVPAALAEMSRPDDPVNPPRESSAALREDARLHAPDRKSELVLADACLASDLRGRDIHDTQGKKIGSISDVIVDLNDGSAPYVVVESGGLLGMGRSERAVPTGALTPRVVGDDHKKEGFSLDVSKELWRQAPLFERGRLSDLENEIHGRNLHHVYAQTWPADARVAETANPTAEGVNPPDRGRKETGEARIKTKGDVDVMARGQQLVLASDLAGEDLVVGDREVGEIDDVVVAREGGRAALLIDPASDMAKDDHQYVIPFDRVIREGSGRYVTDLKREDFETVAADGSAARSASRAVSRWPVANERVGAASGG